jgi:hypothetical protein
LAVREQVETTILPHAEFTIFFCWIRFQMILPKAVSNTTPETRNAFTAFCIPKDVDGFLLV